MPDHTEAIAVANGVAEYREARRFWEWFHTDPDSDQKLDCRPSVAITDTLQNNYGAHPLEADWISRVALDSVIEQLWPEIHSSTK